MPSLSPPSLMLASRAHAFAPTPNSPADPDHQFVAMLRAFRATGGLLRGDEVAELIGLHHKGDENQSLSRLARQIAAHEVISFEWRGERWLPLFQFRLSDMNLHETVRQVADELAPVMNGWELSQWFIEPNPWLHEQSPVDALTGDLTSVVQAARAERFVVRG